MLRKMHLANALDKNNWDAIRKDFNKKPVEKINGNSSEKELLNIMGKYGITIEGGSVKLQLWGTGNPRREFLHSDDMADACVFIMENIDFKDIIKSQSEEMKSPLEIKNTHINIGIGKDLTIQELAEIVKKITGFNGSILWDKNKPDGTMQKLLDVSKLNALGWKHKINLEEGIKSVYQMYIA
jgi:GDP-L-fucose synthase